MQCVLEVEPLQSSMPQLQGTTQVCSTPQWPRCVHEMHKEEEISVPNQEESNKRFDSVSTKSLMFHSMKLIIITYLESNTSQNRVKFANKKDTDSDGNLRPFQVFKILFPRSTMAELHTTINRSIMLKTYNHSNTKQLSR